MLGLRRDGSARMPSQLFEDVHHSVFMKLGVAFYLIAMATVLILPSDGRWPVGNA